MRRGVGAGRCRVQRSAAFLSEEHREGARRDALAPVRPRDPVPDAVVPVGLKTRDAANYFGPTHAVDPNHPRVDAGVGEVAFPRGEESLTRTRLGPGIALLSGSVWISYSAGRSPGPTGRRRIASARGSRRCIGPHFSRSTLAGRSVPVWSHAGMICTGETYKDKVKLTFATGASLANPSGLFNSSLEGNTRRAIDFHEGDKIDEKALKALIRAAVALNTSSAAPP